MADRVKIPAASEPRRRLGSVRLSAKVRLDSLRPCVNTSAKVRLDSLRPCENSSAKVRLDSLRPCENSSATVRPDSGVPVTRGPKMLLKKPGTLCSLHAGRRATSGLVVARVKRRSARGVNARAVPNVRANTSQRIPAGEGVRSGGIVLGGPLCMCKRCARARAARITDYSVRLCAAFSILKLGILVPKTAIFCRSAGLKRALARLRLARFLTLKKG